MDKWILLLICMYVVGCGSTLVITSDPSDAKVYLKKPGATDRVELGVTPLEIRTSEVQEKADISNNSNEYRELIVVKDGYGSQNLFLPPTRFTTLKTQIFAKLDKTPDSEVAKGEQMVQHLFNAQKFAQKTDFEKAHLELEKSLAISPDFVRAISMKATVYYLEGKYAESLVWYEKALQLEPEYEEAVKMISAVRNKLGQGGGAQ